MSRWWEITVHTRDEATEALADWFQTQGVAGIAIESGESTQQGVHGHGQWFDAPINDLAIGEARIQAYFPETTMTDAVLQELQIWIGQFAQFGLDCGAGTITSRWVEDEDWSEAWKEHFQPLPVGASLLIQPTWRPLMPTDRHVIGLDPGMAFGTGHHASTVLSLLALERAGCAGRFVVDIGTGSGILAIAAVRLGATHVWALDIDPLAVDVARANVRLNRVDEAVTVAQSDMLDALPDDVTPQLIVSNILAQWLAPIAPIVAQKLDVHGLWVTAGIVDTQETLVTEACADAFVLEHRADVDGWVAHIWRKR